MDKLNWAWSILRTRRSPMRKRWLLSLFLSRRLISASSCHAISCSPVLFFILLAPVFCERGKDEIITYTCVKRSQKIALVRLLIGCRSSVCFISEGNFSYFFFRIRVTFCLSFNVRVIKLHRRSLVNRRDGRWHCIWKMSLENVAVIERIAVLSSYQSIEGLAPSKYKRMRYPRPFLMHQFLFEVFLTTIEQKISTWIRTKYIQKFVDVRKQLTATIYE